MADLFATIADPTRRALLEALRDASAPLDVPALVEAVGSTRQAVNRHLLALKEAELVTELGDGPERSYAASPAPLLAVEDWLASLLLDAGDHGPARSQGSSPVGRSIGSAAHRVSRLLRRVIRRP